MGKFDVLIVLKNVPLGFNIHINLEGQKECKGILQPFGNLSISDYMDVANKLIGEIKFRDDKQRNEFIKGMNKGFFNSVRNMTPLALMRLENYDIPDSVKEDKWIPYLLKDVDSFSIPLSFNYNLPIDLMFLVIINKETNAIKAHSSYTGTHISNLKEYIEIDEESGKETFKIKPKEDLDKNIIKLSKLFSWSAKKAREGIPKPAILKCLDLYWGLMRIHPTHRITPYWTILTILSRNEKIEKKSKQHVELNKEIRNKISDSKLIATFNEIWSDWNNMKPSFKEKIRVLFQKHNLEKEFLIIEPYWDYRGSWEHYRENTSKDPIDDIERNMRLVLDKLFMIIIDAEIKKADKEIEEWEKTRSGP